MIWSDGGLDLSYMVNPVNIENRIKKLDEELEDYKKTITQMEKLYKEKKNLLSNARKILDDKYRKILKDRNQ